MQKAEFHNDEIKALGKELECDTSEAAFEAAVKKVAKEEAESRKDTQS